MGKAKVEREKAKGKNMESQKSTKLRASEKELNAIDATVMGIWRGSVPRPKGLCPKEVERENPRAKEAKVRKGLVKEKTETVTTAAKKVCGEGLLGSERCEGRVKGIWN